LISAAAIATKGAVSTAKTKAMITSSTDLTGKYELRNGPGTTKVRRENLKSTWLNPATFVESC
jgi:hypothetical protein